MKILAIISFLFVALALAQTALTHRASVRRVGPAAGGPKTIVPTAQAIHAAGDSVEFGGRPVDLALSPDGRTAYLKDDRGIVVVDRAAWRVRQELPFPKEGGGSMHGIAVSRDGRRVWATGVGSTLWEAAAGDDGLLAIVRAIPLPGPDGKGASYPCGLAVSPDGKTLYVCLSRNNRVGVVDLASGKLTRQIPVGVAPFDIALSPDGGTAWVSNWGGRRPRQGERTAKSSGTEALVDARGVASSGTVSLLDLAAGREVAQVATGLHPSDVELARDGGRLYVADANSDTVSVIDTRTRRRIEAVSVRPDPSLPFGSAPGGLALSPDGRTLYVANGGNNAVAVVALPAGGGRGRSAVRGFLPAGWYPGAVVTDGRQLFVANVKGLGSRGPNKDKNARGRHVKNYLGTVNRVAVPVAPDALRAYTARVRADGQVPQMLRARECARSGKKPVPVPARAGEPSVFEHVVYIIKENRTYDQVFGDLPQGDGDPRLCLFGREVTPNHHALAERYVLLDNYYCNGVVSADGHSWATEGNVTDHLEKAFGGFARSYTFGDDPLTYSSSGFLWDNALARGLSFRNFGEFDYAETVPAKATFTDVYRDFRNNTGKIRFTQNIGVENLRRYSSPTYPGWNMRIPDVLRADRFLKELRAFEKRGTFPNLVIVFLPNDHASGTTPGMPTPRAHVADNDLALGRIVEGISKSRFWPKTCIFVNEDDPQDGFDHVDGHRSLCLVISPYTKRGRVVSEFYNQTAVLHTMERILGLPPMNQMDALAPLMRACFQEKPDLRPYTCLPNRVPLDALNKPLARLRGKARRWARESARIDFSRADRADEDMLNRILWHAVKGPDAPYPAHLAGAHGRGLRARGLRADGSDSDD